MATEQQSADIRDDREGKPTLDREDPEHDFVDQSKIDFDPDDGLYAGTAIDGTTQIPGPHPDRETGEMTDVDDAEPSDQRESKTDADG